MKTIFLFLIFAGFSFQSLVSAPINQVGTLDEKDVLKDPNDKTLKQSKHHGSSSSIDPLQELGRHDEALRNDNHLPAKRDPWRRWRSNKSKEHRVKATNSTTSTMQPTTTTTPPTAVVQGHVSVDATGELATSTITLATSTMEPSTTTTPTAAAAHVSSVALTAPAVVEGPQDNIPLSGCTTSINIQSSNGFIKYG